MTEKTVQQAWIEWKQTPEYDRATCSANYGDCFLAGWNAAFVEWKKVRAPELWVMLAGDGGQHWTPEFFRSREAAEYALKMARLHWRGEGAIYRVELAKE